MERTESNHETSSEVNRQSKRKGNGGYSPSLLVLTAISFISLLFGVALPSVRITPELGSIWIEVPAALLYDEAVETKTWSILQLVWTLAASGHYALMILVFVFSVIFPLAKALFIAWRTLGLARRLRPSRGLSWTVRLMHKLARWSMLDVFVIALTVVAFEDFPGAKAEALIGTYLFAVSVITAKLALIMKRRESRKSRWDFIFGWITS